MSAMTRPRIPLHYTSTGYGPDVLLVHGWASSSQMWTRLLRDAQDAARWWALDLYGFGESPRPEGDEPILIEHHLEMLLDFIAAHRLQPRAIIGHSMGGLLTLKLAACRPDLLEKLVLMSPVVSGRYGVPVELNKVIEQDWAGFALARSKPLWILAQNVFGPLFSRPAHWYLDDEAAARILTDLRRASWQASLYGLHSIARENMAPLLGEIQHPALVIVGANDLTVPPDEARSAAAGLPQARLMELPGVHHHPLDEQPAEVVAAVKAFLAD